MNEKIKQYLIAYNTSKGWGITDEDLIETLLEEEWIYSETVNSSRWWNDKFVVVNIDGKEIGFMAATTTGDNSPRDAGWEFEPKTICEVEKEIVTKIKYYAV